MGNKLKGFIYSTGARGANKSQFGQWVTIDMPEGVTRFYDYTPTPNGPVFLSASGNYYNRPFLLPLAQYRNPDRVYDFLPFHWRSKKFVMGGRTTFSVMKVHYKGCVKVNIYADGCCVYTSMLTTCSAFRLPPEVVGTMFEIEFIGKGNAQVIECEIASSLEELALSGQDEQPE